ncbi:MAG: MFS transporter [Verrucomicrobiota bacterium]|nr:MFS transporter [Verrucomicrobiota bacterium]
MVAEERTRITYRNERWRAVSAGVLESAGTAFLLLIAVKWFHAGAIAKALVAGGGSFGLMLSPVMVGVVSRLGWPTSRAAGRLAFIGCGLFFLMAIFPFIGVFVVGSVLAMTMSTAAIPLLTHLYHENYPESLRGRLFSRTVMIRIASAAIFSYAAGAFLDVDIGRFRWLLVAFAMAFALAGWKLIHSPSSPLHELEGTHPFRSLRFARSDPMFRRTLISWMLLGFGNLMMVPIRVEYLANPGHGLGLSVEKVALIVGVVPNLARFVMSPVWGWFFDHLNFFLLRVVLNIGFAVGILSFFTSDSYTGLIIGAVVYGISMAGGDIAWSLWVTKFAPPQRVADYMSVHTFFTGLRGIAAPIAAFYFLGLFPVVYLGYFSAALIVVASLLLLPEIRINRFGRKSGALTEEVSD